MAGMAAEGRKGRVRQVSKERMQRIRRLTERHDRGDSVREQPCPVCGKRGMVVHHVFPIRYGGSYGIYSLMATCPGKCHSRLNRMGNRYCRRYEGACRNGSGLRFSRRIRR